MDSSMASQVRSNSSGIYLLVAESSRTKCDYLVQGFVGKGGFNRVIGKTSISEAKRTAQSGALNVALISRDMREGHQRACELVQFLATLPCPVRSVLMADEWRRRDVIEAFSHGAKGLINSQDADFARLRKAVECVHRGQVWANSEQLNSTLDYLAESASKDRREAHAKSSLSAREREIAQLLAKGASNKQIADALHISERTVKNHLGNIFEKIGVRSRVQAALRFVS
jgi:DNA-binding NarL/FixJ family response regulator